MIMIKLYPIYEQILKENIALSDIFQAIDNHQIAKIHYVGNEAPHGERKIEIYAFGTTKAGNKAIRAYQLSGPTMTGNNKWKIFTTKDFDDLQLTDETFDTPRPKFNPNGDKTFTGVDKIATFKGKSLFNKIGDKVKGAFKSVKDLFKFKKEGLLSVEDNLLLEQYNIVDYDEKSDTIFIK